MFRKLAVLLLLAVAICCSAANPVMAAETANVKDFLGYLAEDQIQMLQGEAERIRDTYGLEPVIVITDDMEGKSSMAYADDYYDYNGYGVGDDKSGLLLLVNMADRDIWISTTGRAIDVFDDARIQYMLDGIVPNLKDSDFHTACVSFLADVEAYAIKGVPEGQYRIEREAPYRGTYAERALALFINPLVILLTAAASLGVTIVITLTGKGRVTVTPTTYEEKGTFALTREVDDFIREMVTRTKVESNDGGSGGSSTHFGGSGTSHGGGGRGF